MEKQQQLIKLILILSVISLVLSGCEEDFAGKGYNVVSGCKDPFAINYNQFATRDDGHCVYESDIIEDESCSTTLYDSSYNEEVENKIRAQRQKARLKIEAKKSLIKDSTKKLKYKSNADINILPQRDDVDFDGGDFDPCISEELYPLNSYPLPHCRLYRYRIL